MWSKVGWILDNIFFYIIEIGAIWFLSPVDEVLEFLVELVESEGSHLLVRGLWHLVAKLPFVSNCGGRTCLNCGRLHFSLVFVFGFFFLILIKFLNSSLKKSNYFKNIIDQILLVLEQSHHNYYYYLLIQD